MGWDTSQELPRTQPAGKKQQNTLQPIAWLQKLKCHSSNYWNISFTQMQADISSDSGKLLLQNAGISQPVPTDCQQWESAEWEWEQKNNWLAWIAAT